MKIGFAGFDLPEGKVKFQDTRLRVWRKSLPPKKSPHFTPSLSRTTSLTVTPSLSPKKSILDLLILDMEKLETRRDRTADAQERSC